MSSDGNPHVNHVLGAEVSAEDKQFMVNAFLQGNEHLSSPLDDDLEHNDNSSTADDVKEEPKNVFSIDIPSRDDSFVTPPTKLLQRSSSAHNVGEQVSMEQDPEAADALSVQKMKARFQNISSKSVSSSKLRVQTHNINYSDEKYGSQEASSSWSERNQRDRKMAFIIILCAAIFVIYNAAAYLYLRPVKVGSTPFNELQLLLELQAELDLPASRFFPILAHVVSLMNPLLTGMDRQIQTEHLQSIIVNFKDSLARWLVVYKNDEGLQRTLREELSIGINMYFSPLRMFLNRAPAYSDHDLHLVINCNNPQVEPSGVVHVQVLRVWPVRQSTLRFFRFIR